jgi:hypothetical protein
MPFRMTHGIAGTARRFGLGPGDPNPGRAGLAAGLGCRSLEENAGPRTMKETRAGGAELTYSLSQRLIAPGAATCTHGAY